MKKKRKKKLLYLFLLLIYFLVAPEIENRQIAIIPAWRTSIGTLNEVAPVEDSVAIPFRIGNAFGYFDESGKVVYRDSVYYNATQTDSKFINYPKVSDNFVINKYDGSFIANIEDGGFPFFINNRLFVFSQNSKVVSEWDTQGKKLFDYESESEITSCDVNDKTFIAGFVDGSVVIGDEDAKFTKLVKPEISRINTVYGVAISADSDYVAVISGIDPQYMFLMKKKNSEYARVYTYQFGDELRYSRYISFSDDGKYLYFEEGSTFYCYDILSKKLSSVDIGKKITGISYIEEAGYFGLTAENGSDSPIFYIVYPDCKILYAKSFTSENYFMANRENRIFLGSGDNIYAVDIVKDKGQMGE